MGCRSHDELRIVHRLLLRAVLAMPIIDLALLLQEEEALRREERPDHVFTHPLGLRLRLGPHQAVNIEAGVPPGENALGPLGAEKLLADKHRQHLSGEDLRQPQDLMEDPRPICYALGHQERQVGVAPLLQPLGRDEPDINELSGCT